MLRSSLLDLLKFSKSPIIQQVLDIANGVHQDITQADYSVYALVSPLWGKCYIGGCGYTRSRCPLERWIASGEALVITNIMQSI